MMLSETAYQSPVMKLSMENILHDARVYGERHGKLTVSIQTDDAAVAKTGSMHSSRADGALPLD